MNRWTNLIATAVCALMLAHLATGNAEPEALQESPAVRAAPKMIPPEPIFHDAAQHGVDAESIAGRQHDLVAQSPKHGVRSEAGAPGCGDGACDVGEDCCNCELDCASCACGDGICGSPCESSASCPADCGCVVDDGTTENILGIGDGGELAWIQMCDGGGDAVTVESILTTFGSPIWPGSSGVTPGETFRVYVWSDPNQDGSPLDAVLVCETSATAEAGSIETDVFQTIPLDPACGVVSFGAGESFFIGASAVQASGQWPGPMDETEPLAHESWVHFNGPPFDPTDMAGASFMDDIGFHADWMLRATLVPYTSDPECTIFNNQAEFEAFNLLHGNGLIGVEDFEEGIHNPGQSAGMHDPLCGGVPNAPNAFPYPNGLDQLSMCVQTNRPGENGSVPNPRGDWSLRAVSTGWHGAASDLVVPDFWVDSLDLMFGDPVPPDQQDDHTGVGFNTVALLGGAIVEIRVFDKNNAIMATAIAPADEVGSNFWGIWCSSPIGRINIHTPSFGGEGGDSIQLWVELPCDPECPEGTECIQGACCGDGVVLGHEECDYGDDGCGTCPWDTFPVDGQIGAGDLAFLLGNWGPIPPDADPAVVCMDAEADGMIGAFDLANLLGNWGDCPVGFGGDNQCVEGDCTALCECVGRGACCGIEGNPADCSDNRTAAECADVGGSYIGDDASCEDCPDPACFDAESSCFEPHDGPGCGNLACCGIVCDVNPLCCQEWDSTCVEEAAALCPPSFCGDGPCDPGEYCCNCEGDCAPCVCGDGICNAPCESDAACPEDCGCVVDDGTTDNSLGIGDGGEIAWIQVCDGGADGIEVESILTTWGSALYPGSSGVTPGETVRVYVWSDPNQDGSPLDAVLVCETSATAEAASIETDVFQTIPLDPACGVVSFGAGESFFIGASAVQASGQFPAPMDETEPLAHESWVHWNGPPFDPTDMDGALFMDNIGFDADWLLRASFTP